jgi:hypothetical protein
MRAKPSQQIPTPLQTLPLDVAAPEPEVEAGAVSGVSFASLEQGPRSKDRPRAPRQDPGLTYGHLATFKRIAERERDLRINLKRAILDGDSRREHALARELCGLPPEAEAGE